MLKHANSCKLCAKTCYQHGKNVNSVQQHSRNMLIHAMC